MTHFHIILFYSSKMTLSFLVMNVLEKNRSKSTKMHTHASGMGLDDRRWLEDVRAPAELNVEIQTEHEVPLPPLG